MTDSPNDRRAALRLELARRSQALDAADRACHERQKIARALAEAPDAAAARGFVVALTAAIDREQAAEDALDGKAPAPGGAKGLTLEELYAPEPPPADPAPAAVELSSLCMFPGDLGPVLAGPLASAEPVTVKPVLIDDKWWVNVAEAWTGGSPRKVTATLQWIVPREHWTGEEPKTEATYPDGGGRVSYRGRLVLAGGKEYVMAGEGCERKVTWPDVAPPPTDPAPPAKKPRKPRAKKGEGVGPGEARADPVGGRFACESCGEECACDSDAPPLDRRCFACKSAAHAGAAGGERGDGFLPGFEAPATKPTAQTEGR